MFKRVVVAESQGANEVDFFRLGDFPQAGQEMLVRDLLANGIYYSGLLVTQVDGVSVQVAAGRVYDSGKQYAVETSATRTVAGFVPTEAGKSVICLVIAQGQEGLDDMSDRYYRRPVDPQNPEAGTQQSVEDAYRISNRKVVINIYPGIESVRPVAPVAPVGSVPVAEILVTTSGIQEITMLTETATVRLETLLSQHRGLVQLVGTMAQAMDGMRADMAGLRAELQSTASRSAIAALQVDMAMIKDRLDIGDDGSPYWADRFLDYAETDYDPVTATGHPDFDALVEEGIRFNHAAVNEFPLSLYAPNDPNLMHAASGLICPKYTNVEGIAVKDAVGTMALGGLLVQTITVQHLTEKRERIRYGTSRTICTNNAFWKSGRYDPIKGIFTAANGDTYKAAPLLSGYHTLKSGEFAQHIRLQQFWADTIDVPYDKFKETLSTISGVLKSQSFLQHQERWSARTWLGIKRWGAGAAITAVLCEYKANGDPDLTRVLSSVTRAAADFKVWPAKTYFPHVKPVFLAPLSDGSGRARQYGIAYFVTGDIDVVTADGDKSFIGGNLQTTTDGNTWDVDLTRDVCFGVDYCQFPITQIPIRLQGWSLPGGIVDIDILTPVICPSSANYQYEINVGGTWRALSAENSQSDFINGVTTYYDARVVLNGTQWGMPIMETTDSRVRLTRPKTTGVWVGPGDDDGVDGWALGETATEIVLRTEIAAWDAARHTATAKMLSGVGFATVTNASSMTSRVVPGRETGRPDQEAATLFEWTFTPAAPVSVVKFYVEYGTNNHRKVFNWEYLAARKVA